MPAARKNISRSYELNLIGYSLFKECYSDFIDYLKKNPDGGEFRRNGIECHYGNINSLVNYLDHNKNITPFSLENVKKVYHLDFLKSKLKKELKEEYNIKTKQVEKSDILIIGIGLYLISIKDTKEVCKLGQTSAEVIFNDTKLKGGIEEDYKEKFDIKKSIGYTDTKLTEEQFSKLSKKDKDLSYIKRKFPEKWKFFFNDKLNNSYDQLSDLEKSLNSNNATLESLLKIMLSGSEEKNKNFYIWIEPNLCNIDNLIKIISQKDSQIETFFHETKNKKSLVITIVYNDKKYGITKIEPSFEGWKEDVSQTKGIIYHFQQYNSTNGSIWDLINASN